MLAPATLDMVLMQDKGWYFMDAKFRATVPYTLPLEPNLSITNFASGTVMADE